MSDDAEGFDLDAQTLATWLRQSASSSWWTIDGEGSLAAVIDLPCRGDELGDALTRHGGRVRIFPPLGSSMTSMPVDLGALAEIGGDGARGFRLAWIVDDRPGESWALVEDVVARDAFEAVAE